jgi:hypothetical protein
MTDERHALNRPSVDEAVLATWCRQHLRADPIQSIFEAGYLSLVVGLELSDGRRVVVKARPPASRLQACVTVQRNLYHAGFPCPEPLAGPVPLGILAATAEAYVPGGEQLARAADSAERFASELARLVTLAPSAAEVPLLKPSLPWVGWDHGKGGTWPDPDDMDADLNAHVGPAWLEEIGRRVRRRLALATGQPTVVGHADWESQNLRWIGRKLHVVHDWDSLVSQPEAAIAGAASAVYTATGAPNTSATIDESEAFLDAYQVARGRVWSSEERELCWAAGLWVRAFNAKKATLRTRESDSINRLASEAEERLRRAGA